MRIVWSVFLLVCLAAMGARGQDAGGDPLAAQAFGDGVDAYRAGDLESARALFSELLEQALPPKDRGIVLFNLGNIEFRTEGFLKAVAYYTAATRSLGRDSDLWHNLELARSRAGLDPADNGDLAATVKALLALPSSLQLESAGWLLLLLFGLALAAEIYWGGRLPKVLALLIALVLLGDLGLLHQRSQAVWESPAMVIAPGGASLGSEPRADLRTGAELPPGEVVGVVDHLGKPGQAGAWVKVSSEQGTGWLKESETLSF